MKIAFCFSGHLRTAEYASDGILKFIGDLLPNVDFFIHTWDKNEYKRRDRDSIKILEITKKLQLDTSRKLDKKIFQPYVPPTTYHVLKQITPKYNFTDIQIDNLDNFNAFFKPIYKRYQPYIYSIYKCNQLKKRYEESFNFKYDIVVITRPDILFPRDSSLTSEIEYLQKFNKPITYLNDVFYMSTTNLIDDFVKELFYQIPNKKELKHISELLGINPVKTLIKYCSIHRHEAIPISSLDYEKCYNIDKDWYWYSIGTNEFRFNTD